MQKVENYCGQISERLRTPTYFSLLVKDQDQDHSIYSYQIYDELS